MLCMFATFCLLQGTAACQNSCPMHAAKASLSCIPANSLHGRSTRAVCITNPHPRCCPVGKDAVSQDNKTLASKLAASPIWLSLTVDADTFPSSSQEYDPLTDWKIVAAAPLILENQLPVAGTYLVWEKPKVGVGLPEWG